MDVAEFRKLLAEVAADEIVRTQIFEGVPFAFAKNPDHYRILREKLAQDLKLTVDKIRVVGSGKTGFSLAPDTFGRQFSDESDIDVMIVDENLFDTIWHTSLGWHYRRRNSLVNSSDKNWAGERKKDIYWGYLIPNRINFRGLSYPESLRPIRDISTKWFTTFKGLSKIVEFSNREISGRLYRTWDLAMLYHRSGIEELKRQIEA